jgi:hypothetical protein
MESNIAKRERSSARQFVLRVCGLDITEGLLSYYMLVKSRMNNNGRAPEKFLPKNIYDIHE